LQIKTQTQSERKVFTVLASKEAQTNPRPTTTVIGQTNKRCCEEPQVWGQTQDPKSILTTPSDSDFAEKCRLLPVIPTQISRRYVDTPTPVVTSAARVGRLCGKITGKAAFTTTNLAG
jgi:hypothetical protein